MKIFYFNSLVISSNLYWQGSRASNVEIIGIYTVTNFYYYTEHFRM